MRRVKVETGEQLSDYTMFFPKVSAPIKLPKDGKELTIVDLTQIPDFPLEASLITPNASVYKVMTDYGFGNAINGGLHIGERWYLNNGNYIDFTLRGTSDVVYTFYYRKDGTQIARPNDAGDAAYQGDFGWSENVFPCCLVGDASEGKPQQLFYYANIDKKFYFNTGGHPNTVYPAQVGVLDFFAGAEPIYQTDDPYDDGGRTETGGGEGDFDNTSEPVDIPALPTLSAVDTKFITLFNPTLTEVQNLAAYMWGDLFDISGWKKIFADPMQAILGLSIVPVNVPSSTAKPVTVGNISTDVSMHVADSQYVEVDCGTLNVNEFWGAYLDYDPYTKTEIYLPYIGTHALATDDVMGKAVHVVYHIDILSGACCAYVKCGESVLYSFIGQCAASIPVTGDNFTNIINGALSIAGSIGSMVATGGMSAPMAIGQIASTAVNAMKPTVEKSGAMSGTGGMLGIQTPYLILTRPRQALPLDQSAYTGYPSFINEKLTDIEGYTEIEEIHLENVPATEGELSEIENLLKSGVIF